MRRDRIKWNRKYRAKTYPTAPSDIVCRHYRHAATGRALDIAAGNGRNALFLAEKGFRVDAIDISEAGLRIFAGSRPKIRAVCADLDNFDLAPNRYCIVLNIRYLNRRLFPQISEALLTGGVLIFETYLKRPGHGPQRPFRDEHLLRPNELLRGFLNLDILYYGETTGASGDEPYPLASLVAVKR